MKGHGMWSQKVTVSGCRRSWRVVKCGYRGLQRVVMKGHQGLWISGGSKGEHRGCVPPLGPKFLYFHAVFGKNWPNNRLAPFLGSWRSILGEILDLPLWMVVKECSGVLQRVVTDVKGGLWIMVMIISWSRVVIEGYRRLW